MKSLHFSRLKVMFFVCISGVCLLAHSAPNVIKTHSPGSTVRLTNGEWAPYLSEQRPHFGLASHIVSEAFSLQGVTVSYGFFSWKRAFDLANVGRWEGSIVWGRREDREEDFYFSDTVIKERNVLYHLQEMDFHWDKYDDLKGLSVGLTKSYNYGDGFQHAIDRKLFVVQLADKDILNLKKLLKKRIDLFPLDYVVAQDLLFNHFTEKVKLKFAFHPKPIYEGTLHLILSKKVASNRALIIRFNSGLRQLKESGRYQRIMADFERGKYSAKISTEK